MFQWRVAQCTVLPQGYVHGYGPGTLHCSDLKLRVTSRFFIYSDTPPLQLPRGSMDIRPFVYGGEDLAVASVGSGASGSQSAQQFPWVTDPNIPWDWGGGHMDK